MALNSANAITIEEVDTTVSIDDSAERADINSYSQILKSSAIIAGSSLITLMLGIIRTKVVAVLLGPAGFGLIGIYGSIADLAKTVATMGLNQSGVRQIAEANGSENIERIAKTSAVLKRISIILGLLGATLIAFFSEEISILTFGSADNVQSITLLSLVVLFGCIAGAQGALIQGMRRVVDLAKMNIYGAILGTVLTILLIYTYRERGIVMSLVGVAAMSILTSWWYSRKIQFNTQLMSVGEIGSEMSGLLQLGFAFMVSGLLMVGSAYAVRIFLLRTMDIETVGLYQAAWTVGGLYIGFILGAMSVDFYPRLTSVAHKNTKCNQLVDEQTQVSILLSGPGVLATLVFAPLAVELFYTSEFAAGAQVLRWICLGMALRVITWPMGFIILAKGSSRLFLLAELLWTFAYMVFTWIFVTMYGLTGAGIAFFASYLVHWILVYCIAVKLSGYASSRESKYLEIWLLSSCLVVLLGFSLLPVYGAYALGILVLAASTLFSIRRLMEMVAFAHLPPSVERLLVRMRLMTISAD